MCMCVCVSESEGSVRCHISLRPTRMHSVMCLCLFFASFINKQYLCRSVEKTHQKEPLTFEAQSRVPASPVVRCLCHTALSTCYCFSHSCFVFYDGAASKPQIESNLCQCNSCPSLQTPTSIWSVTYML